MPKGRRQKSKEKDIEQYEHKGSKRLNNPPVGLGEYEATDYPRKKEYSFDPHFDPQLIWAGKIERTSFKVDTVSLHVHERIEPKTIIEAVRKKRVPQQTGLMGFFSQPEENPPLRDAVQFYKHAHGWSNRLIAGDSLLIMNSLLEKEGMAGKVQMIYIDPPYGIRYNSNFQPFYDKNKMSTVEKDEDLTTEPEMLKAFRDTWELGVHSYLTYLRDRLLLSRELLNEKGSIFVQISEENVHRVRTLLDEIFGPDNFVSQINIKRASVMFSKKLLNNAVFYVVWYAKNKNEMIYNQLFYPRDEQWFADSAGAHLRAESPDGKTIIKLSGQQRKNMKQFMAKYEGWKLYRLLGVNAQGTEKQDGFEFLDITFYPPSGTQWKYSYEGLKRLKELNRLEIERNSLSCKVYLEDFPVVTINNIWEGIGPASDKIYVVQTPEEIIKRCVLMSSNPGDLVLDITCGSGTTAYVAEQWGRRWITCDTSRIAITLAKQRLMTALYDYYELSNPQEGVDYGFKYNTVPHVTLGSIANNEPPEKEILFDQPYIDDTKSRVTGPFTIEAVPAPYVKPIDEVSLSSGIDKSITREGETLRQSEWRDELLKTGIRGRNSQRIDFSFIETVPSSEQTRYLHAIGETKEKEPKRVAMSFGPDHAPMEQRQVSRALEEASHLFPQPKMIIFAAFQFDPEASKDIDEAKLPGVTLLKAQMNADLLTEDLKKKRSSNESFWLIGQPEVIVEKLSGPDSGKVKVEVKGFDYYNTRTGKIESGGSSKIAMWMLDTDYDFRSLYPRQVFFPMAGDKEGWNRLAKSLRAEIDLDLIEQYRGTVSLPFEPGEAIAVKIIDDRAIESLKVKRM